VARYSAFLDACILVPISLADTLLRLAEAGLYRPLWSERILDEVVDAVVAVHPDLLSGAARRRASVMQSFEPDLTVGTLHRQAAATRRPAITTKILLAHPARCGVPGFAAAAAGHLGGGLLLSVVGSRQVAGNLIATPNLFGGAFPVAFQVVDPAAGVLEAC
jgi:hypothetical protein